jgi:hypothetical protein
MAVTDETGSLTTAAEAPREQPLEQVGRAGCTRAQWGRSELFAIPTVAIAVVMAACGSTRSVQTSVQALASASAAGARVTVQVRHPRRRGIERSVKFAKVSYYYETKGAKLFQQLRRIARDGVLLDALSRGDLAGAQAAAEAQLTSPVNHLAHVTRIAVTRGSRVLVNATVNSDGAFVVAPGTRELRLHGHLLGTLLVSLQDVTGFVKLVHKLSGAEVVVRGAGGRVRTSLGAAAEVRLPSSGHVTIAERRYLVRSFVEIGWGNERLQVWILEGV